jgi:hypothetical protein
VSEARSNLLNWIITVRVADKYSKESLSLNQAKLLASAFQDHDVEIAIGPGRYGIQFSVRNQPDVETAISEALAVFRTVAEELKLPRWPIVRVESSAYNESDDQLEAEAQRLQRSSFGRGEGSPLVGLMEVATILGVSKQRVTQLARRENFPPPQATLRAGPVWSRSSIESFHERWSRRSGRPNKQ